MKIFVTLRAIRADPTIPTLADLLETELTRAGHTPFIASRALEKRGLHPGFMRYIRTELESSDLLLLMYHPDLRGGLIEQGIAYALNIPVWLAHPVGLKISTTARECATRLIPYQDESDLILQLQQNLTLQKETP
ncbi:MAG: hypothetical protein H6636_10040 [Anaerolineales bacterium]|nr:hypothetical protein [Anaerolineales bacterium]